MPRSPILKYIQGQRLTARQLRKIVGKQQKRKQQEEKKEDD